MAGLVDFHCHLDLYPDHAAAIADCEREGVRTLTVTTTPKAWPRNHDLTSPTKYVRAALGIHPQLVEERADELPIWENYLQQAHYVGEVGLDAGPRFYRSLEQQKAVFERVLCACAEQGGKVLTVHSVRAAKAVLDMIERHLPRQRGAVVLHWFTGTSAEARRAAELGCYFSINPSMFRTDRHRKLVAALPADRLLTETDGPFTSTDGRPSRPGDVAVVVRALSEVRRLEVAAVTNLVHGNLKALLATDGNL